MRQRRWRTGSMAIQAEAINTKPALRTAGRAPGPGLPVSGSPRSPLSTLAPERPCAGPGLAQAVPDAPCTRRNCALPAQAAPQQRIKVVSRRRIQVDPQAQQTAQGLGVRYRSSAPTSRSTGRLDATDPISRKRIDYKGCRSHRTAQPGLKGAPGRSLLRVPAPVHSGAPQPSPPRPQPPLDAPPRPVPLVRCRKPPRAAADVGKTKDPRQAGYTKRTGRQAISPQRLSHRAGTSNQVPVCRMRQRQPGDDQHHPCTWTATADRWPPPRRLLLRAQLPWCPQQDIT